MATVNTAVVVVRIELQALSNAHQHIARPNQRVQSTPLRVERDRAHFRICFRLDRYSALERGATDAQHVGQRPGGTPSRSRTQQMVMHSNAIVCWRDLTQAYRQGSASERRRVLACTRAS